jgi:signal peptidase I
MTRKTVYRWLMIGAAATAVYTIGNLYQPTVVVGRSMAPTLTPGKVVWVDRTYYKLHRPERGEVVVFKEDGITYIKRVYRGPGEKFYYVSSGPEWMGPVRDRCVSRMLRACKRIHGGYSLNEVQVPGDSVFVLGDNLLVSEDSRQLGPIPIRNIIGRAHVEVDGTKALSYELELGVRNKRVKTQVPGTEQGT